ncbi:cytochrome P450 2J2-like protein [Leptotrombidium deliense]|uniref:Cytochrome P450 2J2-like protein n=1 Tax=Leptotrombidium deliense TaxID=299467 RepID=A0A443SCJ3_9ACAR|nr:cytochrome P450 2J2-like protein [Leptotrombidium deliense]
MLMVNRKLFNLLNEFKTKFYSYLNDVLQERLNDSDVDNFDDLLSGYLKEAKGINSNYFDEQTIMNNFVTMFTAGTVTTAKTLCHAFYLMAVNEAIQRKVQKEIDETIGNNQVSIHDLPRLNYTQAVIAEIHRYTSIGPFTLLHANKSKTY